METNDILFTFPVTSRSANRYSYGVLSISAYLRAKGYDNNIFDYPRALEFKDYRDYTEEIALSDCIEAVKRLRPKIIFISATSPEALHALQLLRELKKVHDFVSVIGGYHATFKPRDFIENGFDYVLRGEGEISCVALVKAIEQKADVSHIPGLLWKKNGMTMDNGPAEVVKDLDELPIPAYDKITMEKYVQMRDGIVRGVPFRGATVAGNRGCPYTCTFCASPVLSSRWVRYRSEEHMEEEIRYLRDTYNVEAIWFTDDILTVNPAHVRKVCAVMRKLGMYWACQARVDLINEKMIRLMKESGCLQIEFGIESGSERILELVVDKGFAPDKVEGAIRLCNRYGIRTLSNFIMGYPTETMEDLQKTIDLAKRIRSSYYAFTVVLPLPGTKLYEMVGEDISMEEYAALNYYGGTNTDKFNKSEIPNLYEMHDRIHRMLLLRSLTNSLKDIPLYLRVLAHLPRKRERLGQAIDHVSSFLAQNIPVMVRQSLKGAPA